MKRAAIICTLAAVGGLVLNYRGAPHQILRVNDSRHSPRVYRPISKGAPMTDKRDPRVDSKPGDVLFVNGERVAVIIAPHTLEDIASWRKRMRNAEVIHAAE